MSPRLLSILLQRSDTTVPWGFELVGGPEIYQPLSIGQVSAKSIAAPYLGPGDEVLSLAGIPASSWTLTMARTAIARPEKALELLVRKHSEQNKWTQCQERNRTSPYLRSPAPLSPPLPSNWTQNTHMRPNFSKEKSGFWQPSKMHNETLPKQSPSFETISQTSLVSPGRSFTSNPNQFSRSTTENSLLSKTNSASNLEYKNSQPSISSISRTGSPYYNFKPHNFEYSQTFTNVPEKMENSNSDILNKSQTTNNVFNHLNSSSSSISNGAINYSFNKNDFIPSSSSSSNASTTISESPSHLQRPSLSPGFFRVSDLTLDSSESKSNYSYVSSSSNYDSEFSNLSSRASSCTQQSFESDSESTLDGSEDTEFQFYTLDKSNSHIANSLYSNSFSSRSDSRTTFSSESGDSEFKFYSLGDTFSSNSSMSSLSRCPSDLNMSNSNINNNPGSQERFDAIRERSNDSLNKIRQFIFGPADNSQAEEVLGLRNESNYFLPLKGNLQRPPNCPPPPPPLPDLLEKSSSMKLKSKTDNLYQKTLNPSASMIIQKAIANQDKKPFTYIPGGGVDFARLRAERLQRGQKAYHHFLNKKDPPRNQYEIQHSLTTPCNIRKK